MIRKETEKGIHLIRGEREIIPTDENSTGESFRPSHTPWLSNAMTLCCRTTLQLWKGNNFFVPLIDISFTPDPVHAKWKLLLRSHTSVQLKQLCRTSKFWYKDRSTRQEGKKSLSETWGITLFFNSLKLPNFIQGQLCLLNSPFSNQRIHVLNLLSHIKTIGYPPFPPPPPSQTLSWDFIF